MKKGQRTWKFQELGKKVDQLAEKIREIARAYGVPIIRKPELTRTIYSTVDLGGLIPDTLYVAVAEVLAMIYRLRHKNKYNEKMQNPLPRPD